MKPIILAALSACAPLSTYRGVVVQDCVTTHVKALTRSDKVAVTREFYEQVVDSCDRIFEGRPK